MDLVNPLPMTTTGIRHLVDTATLGVSGDRYNARDAYRTKYSADQRLGAGMFTAFGVAAPTLAGVHWARSGGVIPGLTPGWRMNTGRAVGAAALTAVAYTGVRKSREIAEDDGHWGAAAAAGGVVAGFTAGKRVPGKYAPLVSGASAIALGIGGYQAGKHVLKTGDGNIEKPFEQGPQVDKNAADRTKSFVRAGALHTLEVSPATQGVSLAKAWGMDTAVKEKYSPSELSGALHGDLLAVGIAGGGALGVGAVSAGMIKQLLPTAQGARPGAALAVAATSAGLAGLTAANEYGIEFGGSDGDKAHAATWAAGSVALTAGTAMAVSKTSMVKSMSGTGSKVAASALASAALIAALSAARFPVQQFVNDAKVSVEKDGGIDYTKAAIPAGLAAAGGGVGAFKVLNRVLPTTLNIGKVALPKWAPLALGTAAAGVATGAAGAAMSSAMPDNMGTTAIATGAGLVAGAGLGRAARGMTAVTGGIAGAALGMSMSTLARTDAPAAPALAPATTLG